MEQPDRNEENRSFDRLALCSCGLGRGFGLGVGNAPLTVSGNGLNCLHQMFRALNGQIGCAYDAGNLNFRTTNALIPVSNVNNLIELTAATNRGTLIVHGRQPSRYKRDN
ncbi:MAG: hypothetical protein ACREE6_05180 [Limisphaerales bacterium]